MSERKPIHLDDFPWDAYVVEAAVIRDDAVRPPLHDEELT